MISVGLLNADATRNLYSRCVLVRIFQSTVSSSESLRKICKYYERLCQDVMTILTVTPLINVTQPMHFYNECGKFSLSKGHFICTAAKVFRVHGIWTKMHSISNYDTYFTAFASVASWIKSGCGPSFQSLRPTYCRLRHTFHEQRLPSCGHLWTVLVCCRVQTHLHTLNTGSLIIDNLL